MSVDSRVYNYSYAIAVDIPPQGITEQCYTLPKYRTYDPLRPITPGMVTQLRYPWVVLTCKGPRLIRVSTFPISYIPIMTMRHLVKVSSSLWRSGLETGQFNVFQC